MVWLQILELRNEEQVLILLRWFHRFVEAATVDVGYLAPHGTEIGAKLTAMVGCMQHHEMPIQYGGMIVDPEEWQRSGPELGGEFSHLIEFGTELIFIPRGNVGRIREISGHAIVFHLKFAREKTI